MAETIPATAIQEGAALRPRHTSPRIDFQWHFAWLSTGLVLNIGCQHDPAEISCLAPGRTVNLDLDRWRNPMAVQGDAHYLPFPDRAFEVVIMGDVLEHLVTPEVALSEACRVSERWVVLTVWEELGLPSVGQHIELARYKSDLESKRLGYTDAMDYQRMLMRQGSLLASYDDVKCPHLSHINRLDDRAILFFVGLAALWGFGLAVLRKPVEVIHNGHEMFNWLICLERWR